MSFSHKAPILVPAAITASNSTNNTAKMARQRAAPDEILPVSQASRQSDKKKILSGVSQSQRGDKLIEIVQ